MIDIHSHILPNVDDGPVNYSKVIEMAKTAVEKGITHIYATPHHLNGRYENPKKKILESVHIINEIFNIEQIPLNVHPGQELRIHRDIFKTLEADEILTLDNYGEYVLLEFPSNEIPEYAQDVVYELLLKGIIPIIVHPERNLRIQEDLQLLYELVLVGAMTQITSGSILGHFGKKIKMVSERIIEHQLAHFIANDAHNTHSRGFFLTNAYETITKKYGLKQTYCFNENAEQLLKGQKIKIKEPLPIKNRLFTYFENVFRN